MTEARWRERCAEQLERRQREAEERRDELKRQPARTTQAALEVREFVPVGKPDEGMRLRRASQDGGDEKPAMALLVCREGWMERSVAKHKSNSARQTGCSP